MIFHKIEASLKTKSSTQLSTLPTITTSKETSQPAQSSLRKLSLRTCTFVLTATLLVALSTGVMSGCSSSNNDSTNTSSSETTQSSTTASDNAQTKTLTGTVSKHERFDSAVTTFTSNDFSQAGFNFGDSFNVSFSNGFTLSDVPYFDGYYVSKGSPVIVAYPNDPFVVIANNNAAFWSAVGLSDGDSVTITLNEAGKYRLTYETLSQVYSTNRADFSSDEQFCNFRALSGGKLKANFLYRGASPVDNSRNRAAITSSLLEKYGIVDVLDLADTAENMDTYFAESDFSSTYAKSLYDQGKVAVLGMASDYDAQAYKTSLAKGVRQLLDYGGPAYIHCMEGKDRTGFVCMLLEALGGASYDEMCADYMTTYANYYGISANETPERYNAVAQLYFNDFMIYMAGLLGESIGSDDATGQASSVTARLKQIDYAPAAKQYLSDCGLSEGEIDKLVKLICE